jgi:hypothetical protein
MKDAILLVDIAFIVNNARVIAKSSSPLIILICKEILFFLKTDLIGSKTVGQD